MKVIVADGEEMVRRVLERLLAARGHACAVALDAKDLERLAREDPPDAVLSGVALGKDDGIAACLRLRRARPDLPIAMMTGDPAAAERVEAAGLGPALRKPFEIEEMGRVLARLRL